MAKRFKTFMILAIAMAFMIFSFGPVVADQSKVPLVGGGQSYLPLDDFVLESESPRVAGDSWYVDSGKSASGDGKSWDYAVITINEAIDLATKDNGDAIHVAPGHTETIDAATDLVCDLAGITIIGYGYGAQRPTLSWADSDAATIPVSAADVVFRNIVFDGSSTENDGPTAMFTVTAAGFQLLGNEVIIADATEAAVLVITGSALADKMKVIGNRFYGSSAETGCDSAIFFSAAAEDVEIAYNTFEADFAEAAIDTGTAMTQINIHHNYIKNTNAGEHAIQLDGNATGVIANCHLVTDTFATAIDAGKCDVFEVYWADDGADDVMATPVLTHEDGATPWSATEVAQIAGGVTDAIELDDLDHLMKVACGSGAYPTNVLANSALAYIMAIDGTITDYDEGSDSLEAISDAVAALAVNDNPGHSYVATVSSSADTTHSVYNSMTGYGTDYFKNGWTMIVLWDAGGAGGAPETEVVDITAYATATGTFTHGATTALGAGDVVLFVRDEFVSMYQKALPSVPVTNSLAYKISKWLADGDGDFATGTALASNHSLVDAIGSTGAAAIDDAASVLGAIGVDDANNAMATTAVQENADGSVFERLEYLQQLSEAALAGLLASGQSVGNVFYVDSVTGAVGDGGTTWALAKATIDQGIGLGTANKGDVVFVAPNHAETLGAAQITADMVGMSIIGLGTGSEKPMLTFNDANSRIDITVAGVTIKNIDFYSTVINSTVAIAVADGGDYFVLDGAEITDTGGFEFTDFITLASGADNITIKNCKQYNTTAGANSFVSATAGAVDNVVLENNNLWGDYTNAAIHSDQINLNMMIRGNTIRNLQAGDHAIQLTDASTGYIFDNNLFGTVPGAILDSGSCITAGNNIDESDITDQYARGMKTAEWRHTQAEFTLDGTSPDTIFTVTGLVEVKIFGHITTDWTAHGDTAAVGTADSTTLLLAAVAGTAIDDEDIWTSATVADAAAAPLSFIINDGDIIVTQSGGNLIAGVTMFHCYWRPLEEGASVTP